MAPMSGKLRYTPWELALSFRRYQCPALYDHSFSRADSTGEKNSCLMMCYRNEITLQRVALNRTNAVLRKLRVHIGGPVQLNGALWRYIPALFLSHRTISFSVLVHSESRHEPKHARCVLSQIQTCYRVTRIPKRKKNPCNYGGMLTSNQQNQTLSSSANLKQFYLNERVKLRVCQTFRLHNNRQQMEFVEPRHHLPPKNMTLVITEKYLKWGLL